MVKVVGISGSPRKGGNTDTLLNSALHGAEEAGGEVVKIYLNDLNLKGCQECGGCSSTGICVIDDDMKRIYRLFEELDVLIVASPVFFSGLSSQTKMMIDRCQCIWARKYLLKKPLGTDRKRVGAFLSVGGRKKSDFSNAMSVIRVFFINIDVEYGGALTYPGIDRKGGIEDHPTALGEARSLGRDLVLSLGSD
jgi:multimeric flavodoxin WrbA